MRKVLIACCYCLAVPVVQLMAAEITHGPVLGRLGQTQVGVWARTSEPATVRVRYGLHGSRLDQLSSPFTTHLKDDNAGWVLLEGLAPNTKYDYHTLVVTDTGFGAGPGGSFRTLPSPEQFRHSRYNPGGLFNFAFEFACGNNQNPRQGIGHGLPAFATMLGQLRDRIHFAILNGDWLYEERRDYTANQWARQVGIDPQEVPSVVRTAPTIVGVWENYKLYLKRGINLAAWHRFIPSFFTFDDHEILNDVYGTGTAGLRDRRAVFRDIGVEAWYDYLGWSNPVRYTQTIHFGRAELKAGDDILTDGEADFTRLNLEEMANLHVHWGTSNAGVNDNALDGVGGDPNAGVYEIVDVLDRNRLRLRPAAKSNATVSYSIGRLSHYRMQVSNCEFFFLDTRTHRELHDIAQPNKPGVSMLGQRQKKWLMDGMRGSDADFFFVVSSVNFMIPHVGGGAVREENKDDAWTVFLEEREELIRFWDALGKPVFVLTGDLHNSFAIKITDRVWEFASGPHNSQNHRAGDEGDRPPNGTYDSRGRQCEIRWSSYFATEIPRNRLRYPFYCVVQVNNVFRNPTGSNGENWVAYPRPQAVFQYYDGLTGELRYAEAIHSGR